MRKGVFFVLIIFMGSLAGCEDNEDTKDPKSGVLASFSTKNTNCQAPCKVQLTNNSKEANKYEWLFGNGNTSTQANPTTVYTKGGEYTISLIAISDGNRDVRSKQIAIKDKYKVANLREISILDFPSESSPKSADRLDFEFIINDETIEFEEFSNVSESDLPLKESVNSVFRNFSDQYTIILKNDPFNGSDITKTLTFSPSNLRKLHNPYPETIAFKDDNGKTWARLKLSW